MTLKRERIGLLKEDKEDSLNIYIAHMYISNSLGKETWSKVGMPSLKLSCGGPQVKGCLI